MAGANLAQQSLAAIEDQLANARQTALAQGMTGEKAEAVALRMVFGDDQEAQAQYEALKASQSVSLAEEDMQGAAQAQADASNDAMLARLQQADLGAQYQAEQAAMTPDQRAQVQAANEARADIAEQEAMLRASMGYPVEMVAGETIDPKQMTAEDFAGVRASMRGVEQDQLAEKRKQEKNKLRAAALKEVIARQKSEREEAKATGEMLEASMNYPVELIAGEDDLETRAMLEASMNYPVSLVAGEEALSPEALARRQSTEQQQLEEQTRLVQSAERQRLFDEQMDRARRAEERATKLDKAAIMSMMLAQQPIGPSTIGEAISGKYGRSQAQTQQDINTARTFFEQSGKIRRAQMTKAQAEAKEKRFRQREYRLDTSSKRRDKLRGAISKAKERERRDIEAQKDQTRRWIAEGNWEARKKARGLRKQINNARIDLALDALDLKELAQNSNTRRDMERNVGEYRRLARDSERTADRIGRRISDVKKEINDAQMAQQMLGVDTGGQVDDYRDELVRLETAQSTAEEERRDFLDSASKQADALSKWKASKSPARRTQKRGGKGRGRLGN